MDNNCNKKNVIRTPKQARSIETKNKLLDAALKLFCNKGFYKTTTKDIAKDANVPIGSLYSYFKNKDTILLEIVDQFNESFLDNVYSYIDSPHNLDAYIANPKELIKNIFDSLIKSHEESKELILELQALARTKPEILDVLNNHEKKITELLFNELKNTKLKLKVSDLKAASIVLYDIINTAVDRIIFKTNEVSTENLLNEYINAICQYIFY